MAELSFPFDAKLQAGNPDRVFNSEDDRNRYASLISDGVYPNPATNLQVTATTGMVVSVNIGKAWVRGAFYINDVAKTLTLGQADPISDRIDNIVVRFDLVGRKVSTEVVKGIPAPTPVAPALTRNAEIYELCLANVRVVKGSSSVVQGNITDTRLDRTQCGLVHALVEQVDTTEIFRQYQAWFDAKKIQYSQDFNDFKLVQEQELRKFVQDFKNSLDPASDVAVQLALRITTNETDIANLKAEDTKLKETDATLLATIKGAIKTVPSVTIATSGWTSDASTGLKKYRIDNADITVNSIVDINISPASYEKASDLIGSTQSFNGYVEIYATAIPSVALSASMIIQKAVI